MTSPYLNKKFDSSAYLYLSSSFSYCSAIDNSSFLIFQNSENSYSSILSAFFSLYFLSICYCLDFSIASFNSNLLLSYSSNNLIAFSSASLTYLFNISSSLFLTVFRCSIYLSIIFYLVAYFSLNLYSSLSFLN